MRFKYGEIKFENSIILTQKHTRTHSEGLAYPRFPQYLFSITEERHCCEATPICEQFELITPGRFGVIMSTNGSKGWEDQYKKISLAHSNFAKQRRNIVARNTRKTFSPARICSSV